jgi:hypothetical protein
VAIELPVPFVSVHYEGIGDGDQPHSRCASQVRAQQAFHMDGRGWTDIAYNALTCPHGWVFEGRGLHVKSAANGTALGNAKGYAIQGMIGAGEQPTPEMDQGIKEAADWFRTEGSALDEVNGHRDWKPTACPGDPLYARVQAGRYDPSGTLPPAPTPPSTTQENGMSALIKGDEQAPWYVTDGVDKRWVLDRAEAQFLMAAKVIEDTRTPEQQASGAQIMPTTLPQVLVDRIPLVVTSHGIPGGYKGEIANRST